MTPVGRTMTVPPADRREERRDLRVQSVKKRMFRHGVNTEHTTLNELLISVTRCVKLADIACVCV